MMGAILKLSRRIYPEMDGGGPPRAGTMGYTSRGDDGGDPEKINLKSNLTGGSY